MSAITSDRFGNRSWAVWAAGVATSLAALALGFALAPLGRAQDSAAPETKSTEKPAPAEKTAPADKSEPADDKKPKTNRYANLTATKPAEKDGDADPKAEPKPEEKSEPKAEPKTEPKAEPKAEPKTELKTEPRTDPKAEPKTGTAPLEPFRPSKTPTGVALPPAGSALPDGKVRFSTKEIDLEALLLFLEKVAGVKVYRSSGVTLPSVRIGITANTPITLEETLDTLDGVLQAHGFTVLDRRPRFVTIIPLATAKTAELPLLPRDPKPESLTNRCRVVRAVFSVGKEDGAALAVSLRSLISPWGDLVHNRGDNSLTVVDTEERVRTFAEHLRQILPKRSQEPVVEDPTPEVQTYAVQHIDPDEAVKLVRSVVLSTLGGSGAGSSTGRPPEGSPGADFGRGRNRYAELASGGSGSLDPSTGLVVELVPRARKLLVRGTTEQHTLVKQILDRIDVPSGDRPETEAVRVVKLKSDPEAIAANLREMFREGESASSSRSRSSRSSRYSELAGPPSGPPGPPLSAPAEEAVRLTIRLTANRDQRCLVISGVKSEVERAEKLAMEIDKIESADPNETVTRTFQIRRGSAEQIAGKLNQLFDGRTDEPKPDAASANVSVSSSSGSGSTDGERVNPYLVRDSSSSRRSFGSFSSRSRSGGLSSAKRLAIADNRLNLLIVIAPNAELAQIERLVTELDRGGEVEIITVPRGRDANALVQQALRILSSLDHDEPEKK